MSGLPTLGERVRQELERTLAGMGEGLCEVAPEEIAGGPAVAAGVRGTAIVAEVPYDGADGAVSLILTVGGARRLAALTGAIDEEEAEAGGPDASDAELGAASALAARLAPSLSGTAAEVMRVDVASGEPSVRVVADHALLEAGFASLGDAVLVPFTLLGEPSRLVVAVPEGGAASDFGAPRAAQTLSANPLRPALHGVSVRVWAELGRAKMPTGRLVGLPAGTIVELDHDADDAVDFYVDGQKYATGRLVVTDDDSWGVRIEHVLTRQP